MSAERTDLSRVLDLAERLVTTTREALENKASADYWEKWGMNVVREATAWAQANLEAEKRDALIEMLNDR